MSESYEVLAEQKAAIEARQAEAAERAKWIEVTPETLPEIGERVLAFGPDEGVFTAIRVLSGRWWPLHGGCEHPTHWQPLPMPPT